MLCVPAHEQVFGSFWSEDRFTVVQANPLIRWSNSIRSSMLFTNPKVHRIGHYQFRRSDLIEDTQLNSRHPIGQEHITCSAKRLGHHRLKLTKHIEVQFQRLTIVHIRKITTPPTKRLPSPRSPVNHSYRLAAPAVTRYAPLANPHPPPLSTDRHEVAGGASGKDRPTTQHVVTSISGVSTLSSATDPTTNKGMGAFPFRTLRIQRLTATDRRPTGDQRRDQARARSFSTFHGDWQAVDRTFNHAARGTDRHPASNDSARLRIREKTI